MFWLFGSLLAGWLAGGAFCDDAWLSAAFWAVAASLPRCQADWVCALADALSLLLLAAVLLSSSEANMSFGCEAGLADLAGGPCRDTFAAASDVTLDTGGLSR